MIRIACAGYRFGGRDRYQRCLQEEIAALARSPGRPSLSDLTEADRTVVRVACSGYRSRGPARY
jgi:hypothetical protein